MPRRVVEVARSEGLRGLWWRTLSATVYRRLVLVAREIDQGPEPARARLDLEFEYLTPDGIGEYLQLRDDASAAEIERRLRAGHRCALARHRGELVSARWFTTEAAEIDYLELAFELPRGVAYLYDVYTSPAARGRGISGEARRSYEEELRRAGTRRLLGTFMPENTAGLGLVSGAGYRAAGMVGCVRLPGVRIPVRRLPPGYLRRSERLRPVGRGRRTASPSRRGSSEAHPRTRSSRSRRARLSGRTDRGPAR